MPAENKKAYQAPDADGHFGEYGGATFLRRLCRP